MSGRGIGRWKGRSARLWVGRSGDEGFAGVGRGLDDGEVVVARGAGLRGIGLRPLRAGLWWVGGGMGGVVVLADVVTHGVPDAGVWKEEWLEINLLKKKFKLSRLLP